MVECEELNERDRQPFLKEEINSIIDQLLIILLESTRSRALWKLNSKLNS